ncbi:MAG: hypothetical protein CL916_06355 [Deltaproteobacteria bacterium]|nr:hypothetical protein [Deltaproteobacteria bacterium]
MIRVSFSLIGMTLLLTIYSAILPIFYSLYALANWSKFSQDLEWASYWGALLPSSQMDSAQVWRVFTAPILHIGLNHLLSNLVILMVAVFLKLWQANHKDFTILPFTLSHYFKSAHDWLSPVYLILWGGIVSSTRVIIGIEAWSLGLSGVVMMYLSRVCTLLASQSIFKQERSTKKGHLLRSVTLFILPWLLALISLEDRIDLSSHLIGTTLGSIYGFWMAKTSSSRMSEDRGKM